MKKLFISSDVHSFYTEWIKALNDAGFDKENKNHVIVHCGDLCDRGTESKEVLIFINSLSDERKICIIGNHEILMEDMIRNGDYCAADISNGTLRTAVDISENYNDTISDLKNNTLWNNYKKSWKWYFEVDKYIFVHGWVPFIHNKERFTSEYFKYDPNWRNATNKQWEVQAIWENGMKAWHNGIKEEGKTILCGHWHASFGHANYHNHGVEFIREGETLTFDDEKNIWIPFVDYTPFIDEGIVALDACTAVSRFVNVYVIEIDDNIWIKSLKDNNYINER